MSNPPDSPQPVRRQGFDAIFGIILSIIVGVPLLVGGIFMYVRDRQQYDLLRQEGVSAMGVVAELSHYADNDGNPIYEVHYSYNVPSGSENAAQTSRQEVSKDFFSGLSTGQSIEIIYAPSRPSVSRIKAFYGPPNMVFWIFYFGFFLLIAILVFVVPFFLGKRTKISRKGPNSS